MGYYFGAVGGGIQGAKLATLRFLYVVDKKKNEIIAVTPEKMYDLLDNVDLLQKYRNELGKETEMVMIEYLKQLNGNWASKSSN